MTSPRTPSNSADTSASSSGAPGAGPLSTSPSPSTPAVYDVVIIGGGAAGLSAAVVLGRARRSVIVVDGGEPRNAPAAGVHSFLTRDGISPAELLRLGREEARSYGAVLVAGLAVDTRRSAEGIVVTLADGTSVTGRRLVVATGLVDELPDVAGLADRWGRDVLHCPYCHGWEVRDQSIGILGTGPMSVHQALLFRQWSSDVTLFLQRGRLDPDGDLSEENGPTPDEWEQLAARGIGVVIGPVESLEVRNDALVGVRLAGGELIPVTALVVAPTFTARTGFLTGLGVTPMPHPMGVGEHLDTDETGRVRTDGAVLPGVWAAGNATNLMAQVIVAAAAGLGVATAVNADLIAEETDTAVAAYRTPLSAAAEAAPGFSVPGDRRHGFAPPLG